VAVLRPSVPTLKRELWYEKQLKEGVEVVICHPKLVETGLDYVEYEMRGNGGIHLRVWKTIHGNASSRKEISL